MKNYFPRKLGHFRGSHFLQCFILSTSPRYKVRVYANNYFELSYQTLLAIAIVHVRVTSLIDNFLCFPMFSVFTYEAISKKSKRGAMCHNSYCTGHVMSECHCFPCPNYHLKVTHIHVRNQPYFMFTYCPAS